MINILLHIVVWLVIFEVLTAFVLYVEYLTRDLDSNAIATATILVMIGVLAGFITHVIF